jgi:hypothetical protein
VVVCPWLRCVWCLCSTWLTLSPPPGHLDSCQASAVIPEPLCRASLEMTPLEDRRSRADLRQWFGSTSPSFQKPSRRSRAPVPRAPASRTGPMQRARRAPRATGSRAAGKGLVGTTRPAPGTSNLVSSNRCAQIVAAEPGRSGSEGLKRWIATEIRYSPGRERSEPEARGRLCSGRSPSGCPWKSSSWIDTSEAGSPAPRQTGP